MEKIVIDCENLSIHSFNGKVIKFRGWVQWLLLFFFQIFNINNNITGNIICLLIFLSIYRKNCHNISSVSPLKLLSHSLYASYEAKFTLDKFDNYQSVISKTAEQLCYSFDKVYLVNIHVVTNMHSSNNLLHE